MKTITLCSKPRGCCAKLTLDYDTFIITDDNGGCVSLNKDEYRLLKQKMLNKEFDEIIDAEGKIHEAV